MKESKSLLNIDLSFIDWVSSLQKDIEERREEEQKNYSETSYINGFLQALELVRCRYLKDQGIHTMKPKTYVN